ncbi:hypothetical protein SUGI_0477560 [Cryptomeria japonica]|nr:hypothetical protein SUGI_0477560 [Cryptomeria japonica]
MAGEKRDRSPASSASSDESTGRSPRGTSTSPVRNSSAPPNSKLSNDPAEKSSLKRGKSLSVDVCRDFSKGRCKRSPLDCKYAHPSPAVAVEENKVTVCFDSLRDRCLRGITCRYYHPSPRIRVSLQEAAGIQPTTAPLGYRVDAIRSSNLFFGPPGLPHPLPVLSPPPLKTMNKLSVEVCRDYVRGRCSREADECRYAHHAPTAGQGDHVTVCADYLRGRCERNSCRYFHAPDHLRSRIKDVPIEPAATFNSVQYNLGMDIQMPVESAATFNSVQYNMGMDIQMPVEPAATFDPVQYNLGMDTPYAFHPSAYDEQSVKRMKTRDNADDYIPRGLVSQQYEAPVFQVPAIGGPQLVPPPVLRFSESADDDRLPVCRDYQKSKCSRDSSCKYAHPEPHTQVVDNYVTICRDFQRGKYGFLQAAAADFVPNASDAHVGAHENCY